MFGLASLLGGSGGGGLPGLTNSSSAESDAGPVTVGGLTFAPSNQDTIVMAVVVIAAAFAAVAIFKKA